MLRQKVCSSVAVLMVLGLSTATIAPIMMLEQPASAGILSQRRLGEVLSGTTIRVAEPNGKKIIIRPDEKFPATLETKEAVRSDVGTILIPKGSKIEGEFRPANGGTQFVAKRIILLDGTERELEAETNVVDYRKNIQKGTNADPIWQGALVGAGASILISSIVSDIGIFKTLGGAGAGALAGWLIAGRSKKSEVIVVRPTEDLNLTLKSDLFLNRGF